MSQFAYIITDNQATPLVRGDLGDEITDTSFDTLLPGGCGDCTFKLHRPIHFTPLELAPLGFNYRLNIVDGRGIFWSGRIERVVGHRGSDGEYFSVTARGYGVNLADQIIPTYDAKGKQTSAIIADAIASYTQQIDSTSIIATGQTLDNGAAISIDMLTPAQIMAWAMKFGNSSNQQQLLTVYPDDSGSRILYLKARPTTPDLMVSLYGFDIAEFGFDGQFAANRIDALYNGGATALQVNNTTLQGAGPTGWGITKSLKVILADISAGADATLLANAQLAIAQTLKMIATNLQCKTNVQFIDINSTSPTYGQAIPAWRIRAGMLLQIADILPVDATNNGLSYFNSCLITKTTFKEETQTLTILPESFADRLESMNSLAINLLGGRVTL